MVRGLKVASLFLGYASLGFGGDYMVGLLGQEYASPPQVVVEDIGAADDIDVHVHVRHSDRCAYGVERRVELDASAAELLRLRAGSGALTVSGREGLGRVQAVGMACASHEDLLKDLRLSMEQVDGEIVLSAHYPRSGGWNGGEYARIDLAVEIPLRMAVDLDDSSGSLEVSGTGALRIDDSSGLAVEIPLRMAVDLDDSSGSMEVSGTGALRIDDSSGSILVWDVFGDVLIDDSSGEVELRSISGDVSVDDGSGGIDLRDIDGSVRLRDGSGSVSVVGVGRDVVVERDGSGSIEVRDVNGDFSVRADGSGSIRYSGVAGTVDIPSDKQRRRRGN
ncbi:MAG: hypothetical protein P8170_02645 [Gemmatimonadota bacterium]